MEESVKQYQNIFWQILALTGILVILFIGSKIIRLMRGPEAQKVIRLEQTITIPEGFNVRQIGAELERQGIVKSADFITVAQVDEGYLFPDTYKLYKNSNVTDVIQKMKGNFDKKIDSTILNLISKSGYSEKEIITMASILEEEVRGTEDRKIVAGILWKRIKVGMFINVDSTLTYVLGRGSKDLTLEDLKFDSPFNTYLYKGLPPTPISNPGLDAISAALSPVSSPYFYYLTDSSGMVHYAKTLEEQTINKNKYIR